MIISTIGEFCVENRESINDKFVKKNIKFLKILKFKSFYGKMFIVKFNNMNIGTSSNHNFELKLHYKYRIKGVRLSNSSFLGLLYFISFLKNKLCM